MGNALALAGQAAANQTFFTIFFLVSYLPTITAPLVASAIGSGNPDEAQQRVCESLFLCNLLGALGTLLLVGFPTVALSMILPKGAAASEYAIPYLRFRGASMIPALLSATGFAAFRGAMDTVTPLKVSLATNLLNLVLDPLFIFKTPMGFVGAAVATALSETASGFAYIRLLLKCKLARISRIMRPPSWKSLLPLLQGGASILGRQLALNIGFVSAARRAQSMDPTGKSLDLFGQRNIVVRWLNETDWLDCACFTGVSAAAYGIVMQMYSIGIVVHVAMQGTASALVPSTLARSGKDDARRVADRIFVWGSITGVLLGLTQFLALPFLVPLFSTLPEVQQAVRVPALLASVMHVINGPVFAGEGTMLGLACYKDLMLITMAGKLWTKILIGASLSFATLTSSLFHNVPGIVTMVACLTSPLGQRLDGILLSLMTFCSFQAIAVVTHYLKFGPLAVVRADAKAKAK
jgi:Na+-driven multidrug efflux pump